MKRRAGAAAAEEVQDGDVVGLGSGSTAAAAIEALGRRVDAGLDVTGIPTSHQSRSVAIGADVPLTALDVVDGVDIAIDGADQEADGNLIKGGGGAHAREKVVDAAADRFVVVLDRSKPAAVLDIPVPIEVLQDVVAPVKHTLERLGGEPVLRSATAKSGPVVTDNGNVLLDCDFGEIEDPSSLATDLASIPGVVAHGLFVGLADEVIVAGPDDIERRQYG
ncbi:MAG: ribose-5-phosphate isomerase RpiA [Halodesulfurarchaeum sp.]